jgi:hypothetical protein
MGLSVDTSNTFDFVLIQDRSFPKEQQRSLRFKYVSARTCGKIRSLFLEALDTEATDDFIGKVGSGVRLALIGWTKLTDDEGNPVEYDPSRLDEVLTQGDFADLLRDLLPEMSITEGEKKRLALLSPVITVKSVGETVTATA